jgi:hypothetical protein
MALNALVGALRVNLGLDSAQFETGLKKSQRQAQTFSSKLGSSLKTAAKSFAVVGAAATAMAAAVAIPLKRAAKSLDDLAKSAQKVGIGAEDLAKLQYAAGLAGVEAKGLETGLARLNIALADMGKKAAPEASRALAGLGITTGTTTLDALKQLADKFQQMPDGVAKSAAAIKILGRSGADLIPLLNGGSAGIAALADEAQRFGLVVDTSTARAAEQFNDNMSRMGLLAEGAGRQFAAGIIPTLVVLTNKLLETANTGPVFLEFGKNVGRTLVSVAELAFVVKETVIGVVGAIGSLGRAAVALYTGGVSAAAKVIIDQDNATSAAIEARRALFAELRKDIENFKPGAGNTISGIILPEDLESPLAEAKRLRDEIDKIIGSPLQLTSELRPETLAAKFKAAQGSLIDFASFNIEKLAATLPDISNGFNAAMETATRFGENLAQSLGQALVFGQSLGDALKSSIRAAAAELVTSGLLNLLLGQKDSSGVRSGGFVGGLLKALPFFANGTNSAPGGLAMVGERGRELVGLPQGAKVWSNSETERMMRGGGESRVVVDVQPSPFFVTTVTQATQTAAASAVGAFANQQRRPRIAGAFG